MKISLFHVEYIPCPSFRGIKKLFVPYIELRDLLKPSRLNHFLVIVREGACDSELPSSPLLLETGRIYLDAMEKGVQEHFSSVVNSGCSSWMESLKITPIEFLPICANFCSTTRLLAAQVTLYQP